MELQEIKEMTKQKYWDEAGITEFCETLTTEELKGWIDRTFRRAAFYANGYACVKNSTDPKHKTMIKCCFKEFVKYSSLEFLLKDILKNRE